MHNSFFMKTQNDRTFISFFLSHIVEYLVWILPMIIAGIAIFLSGLAKAYYSDYFEYKIIGMSIFLLLVLIIYPLEKIIREKESKMKKAAKELQFELATVLRDEVKLLRDRIKKIN